MHGLVDFVIGAFLWFAYPVSQYFWPVLCIVLGALLVTLLGIKENVMRCFLAVVFLTLAVGSLQADDYCRPRTVYQTYAAPVYQAPTYQYTPAYNYQQIVLIPKAVPVDVQSSYPDHYYSIDPSVATERIMKATAEIMLKQRDADRQDFGHGSPAPQPNPVTPGPAPLRAPAPAPLAQPLPSTGPRASAYQDAELIGLIQNRCVKCHQAEQKMALLTPDGKLMDLTKAQALNTFWLVTTNQMPKTAPNVEDKFMPLFSKWIEASK
jgi:hypothetical protein